MRFISMVKATKESEDGRMPDPKLMEAVGKHAQEMMKAGVVLMSAGLAPSSQGARVRVTNGKLSVVDGPFAETTELIGGFAILQAKSREEAIELGKRFMKLHLDVMGPGYTGELEIRQLFSADDFGPMSQPTDVAKMCEDK